MISIDGCIRQPRPRTNVTPEARPADVPTPSVNRARAPSVASAPPVIGYAR
ncbi:hypothetical protein OG698_19825 [Streptomyces sp. NBC_01003]|uniref:hypothetical protein n=1 Tax=Streptomyces sp. NBC_01003 TaxID=2903714 RepID=UPI003867589E|nr:hypothetical protein OG698_19825 [Streptomyces sp. NBC_01003]